MGGASIVGERPFAAQSNEYHYQFGGKVAGSFDVHELAKVGFLGDRFGLSAMDELTEPEDWKFEPLRVRSKLLLL